MSASNTPVGSACIADTVVETKSIKEKTEVFDSPLSELLKELNLLKNKESIKQLKHPKAASGL